MGWVTQSHLCGALLLAALLAAALLYRAGMTGAFSSDDYPHLLKNIHFEDLFSALSVFCEADGREYRPLVRLSLWLNHQLAQDATAFHWTNLILHLSNAACLFVLLRLLFGRPGPALVGGAAFALHPIHSTNVLFVMGRTDLLFSLFYLGSALLFLLHRQRGGARTLHALSLLLFGLALLAKEMAISLPALLWAMLVLREGGAWPASMAAALRRTLPHFLLLLGYAGLRLQLWSDAAQDLSGYLNFGLGAMLRKLAIWSFGLVYPFDLYELRHLFERDPLRLLALAGAAGALGLLALLLATRGRWRRLSRDRALWLGAAWFPITLLPILGGNPHRWYLYLPSAGFCMVLGAIWRLLPKRGICAIALLAGLLFYARELAHQAQIWSRQSELSEAFLQQAGNLGWGNSETHYFANVPFGYKSAFLFTFDSLTDALELRLGARPDIRILSYVNLSDELRIESARVGDGWQFRLAPDAQGFFLFPPAQRRFAAPTTLKMQGAEIAIQALSSASTASAYQIRLPSPAPGPLHCFDGLRLRSVQ